MSFNEQNPELETFEAPESPDLEPRAPAPEEIDPKAVWDDDEDPTTLQASAELVDLLADLISQAGEPPLATWERALLIWSLEGLDISAIDLPQPQKALAGCGAVAAVRIFKKRRATIEPAPQD